MNNKVMVGSRYLPFSVDEDVQKDDWPGIDDGEGNEVVIWGEKVCANDDGGVRGKTPEDAREIAKFIVKACNNHHQLAGLLSNFADYYTLSADEYENKYYMRMLPIEKLAELANKALENIV